MKPEMKKLIIANLPYLLFVYLFGKLGQTYRLAAGADLSEKLLHLADGFSLAFESAAPSFHLFDLVVGVAGAVALRLMVYCKSKNAKKYRRGVEYGSARWGGPKDIAPYIDPVFDNNILLTQTERLTMNNRPKDPKTARNKNVLVIGGQSDAKILRIAPTVMKNVTWEDAVMGEEIFGPILPILTYESLDDAIQTVESHPHPLALYFFSEDKAAQKKVLDHCHFGGGCINDTIIHLATSAMPFGGIGESGMGGYHGKAGFDEFTHYRSIVDKKTWMDLPVRYQRYNKFKRKMLRMFLK